MARIAFLGLGKMGVGMAACFARAGHHVTVWNRTPERAAALASASVSIAATPAEAAANADAIMSMVADDEASQRVWLAPDGALAAAKPGAFAIECSTVSYSHVMALAAKSESTRLRFIDSPVNGAPTAAADGKLTLLIGASLVDLDAARPILSAISTSVLHFGAIGTGTAFKLINNLYGAVQIAGLAEAVALANTIGLDKEVLIAAIETGPCGSPHVKRLVRGMVEGRIADMPGLSIGLREKDARYSLGMAEGLGAGMAVSEVAHRWYAAAKPASGADDDSALVATVISRKGQV
jgi:3-hydroxyisobutyrate dehydrogenase-like beta-hydroxyacid dehydrogenase